MINPKLNKPKVKINKGSEEEKARERRNAVSGYSGKGRKNFDAINWRSKKGLPPLSGSCCRSTKHAKATLPVFGDP